MLEITVREFIENIRKNGFEQIKGSLYQYKSVNYTVNTPIPNEVPFAACAFGQGLINSHAKIIDYGNEEPEPNTLEWRIYTSTWTLNDESLMNLTEIADALLEIYSKDLNRVMHFEEWDYGL